MSDVTRLTSVKTQVSDETMEALKALAEKQDRSLSWLIRRAVDSYIETQASEQAA